jgi:UDP-N-acetylmuramoyl-tripeptide--D-alanyl-D-alanine ligase
VTGSNGKTTVTQMIAAILRACAGGGAGHAGNFNNDIGVPLTCCASPPHRVAVVELGMNHPGEIAELAAIAQPTVALVNNAQREHQEFMHTVEAVARENGSVLAALPADGVAVFPAGDAYTALWRTWRRAPLPDLWRARRCALHTGPVAGRRLEVSLPRRKGAGCALHIAGRHNVRNALAAGLRMAAGVPLAPRRA